MRAKYDTCTIPYQGNVVAVACVNLFKLYGLWIAVSSDKEKPLASLIQKSRWVSQVARLLGHSGRTAATGLFSGWLAIAFRHGRRRTQTALLQDFASDLLHQGGIVA
jgi:hypothetical protein